MRVAAWGYKHLQEGPVTQATVYTLVCLPLCQVTTTTWRILKYKGVNYTNINNFVRLNRRQTVLLIMSFLSEFPASAIYFNIQWIAWGLKCYSSSRDRSDAIRGWAYLYLRELLGWSSICFSGHKDHAFQEVLKEIPSGKRDKLPAPAALLCRSRIHKLLAAFVRLCHRRHVIDNHLQSISFHRANCVVSRVDVMDN